MNKQQFDKLKADKRRYNIWKRTHGHMDRPVRCHSPKAKTIVKLKSSKVKYEVQANGEWRKVD